MKRLTLILTAITAITAMTCSAQAQTFDYSSSIEGGYYTGYRYLRGNYVISEGTAYTVDPSVAMQNQHPSPSFYADLGVGLHFFDKRLNLDASVMTTFTSNSKVMNFDPLLASYTTDLYYDFTNLPIKVGWRHNCVHTVDNDRMDLTYQAAFNNVYFELTIKQ